METTHIQKQQSERREEGKLWECKISAKNNSAVKEVSTSVSLGPSSNPE